MRTDHDRGMKAVARVRDVRERDSRIGLLQALGTVREREEHLSALQEELTAASDAGAGSLAEFVASRTRLTAMAVAVRDAQQRLDSARTVATESHHRWQADKSRQRAIEHLLEQRAHRRAEDALKAEVREVDDIVGGLHTRTHRTPQKAAS